MSAYFPQQADVWTVFETSDEWKAALAKLPDPPREGEAWDYLGTWQEPGRGWIHHFRLKSPRATMCVAASEGWFPVYGEAKLLSLLEGYDDEPRCPDCGMRGERAGHQECMYPQDHP